MELRYYTWPTVCLESVIQYLQCASPCAGGVSDKKANECIYKVGVSLSGVKQNYIATLEALYGTPMCDDPRKPQRQRLDSGDNEGGRHNKPSICKRSGFSAVQTPTLPSNGLHSHQEMFSLKFKALQLKI